MTPLQVLLSAFGIAAIAGVASFLQSKQPLTARALVATTTYTGMMGFATAALYVKQYVQEPYVLFGIAALLGLSGVKAVDLLFLAWNKLGIKVVVGQQPADQKGEGTP